MEREQIIKALECCVSGDCFLDEGCPFEELGDYDYDMSKCTSELAKNALSLIKELTEEKNKAYVQGVLDFAERIKNYYSHLPGGTLPAAVEYHVDQIAKEMTADEA